ncbi:Polysaccharide deacetylase [Halogranum amylolyticum]|uniref:Polysaccharide deacetylase n=1 Tax=Halogranum amylolyticum TaxID=660520 RepID=A0A1H8WK40_9EURY|nr:polysaccharide deacetylase family protein [Halogranum amylolyticum]SEP28064.1 Polysaccharide deacetylase [Halogranum amylolyticum]
MASDRKFRRRTFLGSIAAASSTLVAGCSGGTGSTPSSNTSENETNTGTGTGTGTSNSDGAQSDVPGTNKPMNPKGATFEDLSFWQAQANVTLKGDSKNAYQGSQSARIEGSSGSISREFPVPMDFSNKDISIAVKLDKPEPTNLRIWLEDSNGDQTRLIQQLNQNHPDTWMRINPSINSAEADMASVESMLITLDGDGANKKYWVDDIRFHEKQADKGQVMLSFDDIHASVYHLAFPIMEEFGLKGVLAVSPDIIGNDGRMTKDEIQELHDAGWEIASHGNDMQGLYGLRRSAQEKKIKRAKKLIKDNGWGEPTAFMYPGGGCDENTVELVRKHHELGYLAFKGSEKGLSQSAIMGPMFVNRSRPNTHKAVKNQLDVATAYNGLYNIYLHVIGDDAQNDKQAFRQMCQHIADYKKQGKVEVVQPSDVVLKE